MADIAFINRDICASNFGDILIVNDDDDIIQMAINNMLTVYGSNQFHPTIGNVIHNERHKLSQKGLTEIASKCKNAILQDPRVANVMEITATNASTFEDYGMCDITFILLTTYGARLSSAITISLYT